MSGIQEVPMLEDVQNVSHFTGIKKEKFVNEDGFCKCGCGRKTEIIKQTQKGTYRIKGEYSHFVVGHKKIKEFITKEQLKDRLESGEKQKDIAHSLGVTPQTLQYFRKKWGLPLLKAAKKADHCLVEGCSHEVHGRGLCNLHFKRNALYGDPFAIKIRERGEGTPCNKGYWFHKINGTKTLRHRLIMEEILGRKLLRTEEVHHKDFDRSNDSPDNLIYCANRKEHRQYHKGPRIKK